MTKSVLIVDDSADVRSLLKLYLERRGYQITTANDGEDALAKIRSGFTPDCILVDMIMDGMGGPAFLEAFESDRPDVFERTAIIGTSALATAPTDKIDEFIKKPIDLDELVAALLRH